MLKLNNLYIPDDQYLPQSRAGRWRWNWKQCLPLVVGIVAAWGGVMYKLGLVWGR